MMKAIEEMEARTELDAAAGLYDPLPFLIGSVRKMIMPSGAMLACCHASWAACFMLLLHQTARGISSCFDTNDHLVAHSFVLFWIHLLSSIMQIDSIAPYSSTERTEIRPLHAALNVALFLLLALPFYFFSQMATGEVVYCDLQESVSRFYVALAVGHVCIAGLRFWRGFYTVLPCLLVAVVSVAFNVRAQGQPDYKFPVLALAVLLLALSNLYFWVRDLEVARVLQQEQKQQQQQHPLPPKDQLPKSLEQV